MSRLAILAGQGGLPLALSAAHPGALFVRYSEGEIPDGAEAARVSYERFGEMFGTLRAAGVTEVVLAGALARPALNPANFDAKSQELAPRFLSAMQGGDDGLLRDVITAFEEHDFAVRGAHELLPELTAEPGQLTAAAPTERDSSDGARALHVLEALGALDLGQGAVVAQGQPLGIETVQGTDAMLRFVAQTRPATLTGGVLVKAPKPGQDLRVDMPAIGPDTVSACAAAGLSGILIAAAKVLIIDRAETLAAADAAGLFIAAVQA